MRFEKKRRLCTYEVTDCNGDRFHHPCVFYGSGEVSDFMGGKAKVDICTHSARPKPVFLASFYNDGQRRVFPHQETPCPLREVEVANVQS